MAKTNFMYPRTINITRNAMVQSDGEGLHQSEVKVMSDVAASIQLKRARPIGPAAFPGPTQAADAIPEWLILFKGVLGVVEKGDKITDDTGIEYFIEAPYWNSLGYNVTARLYHP